MGAGSIRVVEGFHRNLGTVEALLEVLVRRAVVATRQRLALTGRALARVRAALSRDPVEAGALGHALEERQRQRDVAIDHVPDPALVLDREVHPHLGEQRASRAGEVTAVIGEAPNHFLTGVEDGLLVATSGRIAIVLDDCRGDLTVDRTAEAVHLSPYPWFQSLEPPGLPCASLRGMSSFPNRL